MPTPHVTPPGNGTASTWQIGTYNAVTDTWTLVLDLNDRSTWFVKTYDIAQPEKVVSRSGNPRTQGERITNERYKNRYITLTLQLRSTTTLAAIDTAIHSLESALSNTPLMLRLAEAQAAQYSYAVVKSWIHNIPQDPLQRLAMVKTSITLVLECEPFLLGDKLYLDNLVINPGFEAPSGPGVQVFADTFASTNAYALQAGGAPSLNASTTWVDVVTNATLARFLRLGESSGTTAYDIAGLNQPGTSTSVTLGSTALVSGDTGTSYLFNGTTSKVTVPTTGLPTGNSALSFGVGFRISANPAASAMLAAYGNGTPTIHQNVAMYVTTTGKLAADVITAGTITGTTTITLNANHLAEVTWDGTTLTLYLDGVSQGTSTPGAQSIPASPVLSLGVATSLVGNWFTGNLQEFFFYNAAATGQSARWTAFSTGATGTQANSMSLPAAARVAFGSPAWGALNTWQTRFRWVSGLTGTWYLHYTDASNYLLCNVAQGAFTLQETVSGTVNTVATVAPVLTHEAWYWLQVTQFPITSGNVPMLQASLFYDDAGVIGSAVTSGVLGPVFAANGTPSYFIGKPQIAATGAALALGGNFPGVHTMSIFGPGGWYLSNAGTGVASGAWEQNTANTYTGGVVNSYGAGRIDVAPAGTLDARWSTWDGTGGATGAKQYAIPTSQNHVLGLALAYKTTAGLSATSAVNLLIVEYNSSGTLLTTGTKTILSGVAQTAWTAYSSTYTVSNAATAYVRLQLQVTDSTANSANASVWFDNVQCWDQTANGGQTTMPYCELRFPQSPAQLLVSGLVGDVATPAYIASGSFASSFAAGSTLSLLLGRRAQAHANARLINYPSAYAGAGIATILDSGSYGGYYWRSGSGSTSDQSPLPPGQTFTNTLLGVYAFLHRARTSQTTPNLANLSVYAKAITFSINDTASVPSRTVTNPFSASNTWTLLTLNPVSFPPFGMLAFGDPSQITSYVVAVWADSTGGGSQWSYDTAAYLPIDGEILVASFIRPTTMADITNRWIYIYADGLAKLFGAPNALSGTDAAWGWSTNSSSATPTPATAVGGAGTTTSANSSINPTGHAYLQLDPHAGDSTGATGVNQFLASAADQNGNLYGVSCSLAYTPLYLDPR